MMILRCENEKCGHEWIPRDVAKVERENARGVKCPKCKSSRVSRVYENGKVLKSDGSLVENTDDDIGGENVADSRQVVTQSPKQAGVGSISESFEDKFMRTMRQIGVPKIAEMAKESFFSGDIDDPAWLNYVLAEYKVQEYKRRMALFHTYGKSVKQLGFDTLEVDTDAGFKSGRNKGVRRNRPTGRFGDSSNGTNEYGERDMERHDPIQSTLQKVKKMQADEVKDKMLEMEKLKMDKQIKDMKKSMGVSDEQVEQYEETMMIPVKDEKGKIIKDNAGAPQMLEVPKKDAAFYMSMMQSNARGDSDDTTKMLLAKMMEVAFTPKDDRKEMYWQDKIDRERKEAQERIDRERRESEARIDMMKKEAETNRREMEMRMNEMQRTFEAERNKMTDDMRTIKDSIMTQQLEAAKKQNAQLIDKFHQMSENNTLEAKMAELRDAQETAKQFGIGGLKTAEEQKLELQQGLQRKLMEEVSEASKEVRTTLNEGIKIVKDIGKQRGVTHKVPDGEKNEFWQSLHEKQRAAAEPRNVPAIPQKVIDKASKQMDSVHTLSEQQDAEHEQHEHIDVSVPRPVQIPPIKLQELPTPMTVARPNKEELLAQTRVRSSMPTTSLPKANAKKEMDSLVMQPTQAVAAKSPTQAVLTQDDTKKTIPDQNDIVRRPQVQDSFKYITPKPVEPTPTVAKTTIPVKSAEPITPPLKNTTSALNSIAPTSKEPVINPPTTTKTQHASVKEHKHGEWT